MFKRLRKTYPQVKCLHCQLARPESESQPVWQVNHVQEAVQEGQAPDTPDCLNTFGQLSLNFLLICEL